MVIKQNLRETWECRYFFHILPLNFPYDYIDGISFEKSGPFEEVDIYFLTSDDTVNIKIRLKPNIIKRKKLIEKTKDGSELWRTEIESTLPISEDEWQMILPGAHVITLRKLAGYSSFHNISDLVEESRSMIECVKTQKIRIFLSPKKELSDTRLEVTQINILGESANSICFESANYNELKELKDRFHCDFLRNPSNYITYIKKANVIISK